MASNPDTLPQLLIANESDPATARRIRRLAADGRLRRLHAGVYTSNLTAPPEALVLRHWQSIVGALLPGGVISHRSAFDGRPHEGSLSVTRGKTRRTVRLPGLTIHVIPGPGPKREGTATDAPYGSLFLASDPRRYLENLTRGRGWTERVLPQEALEASLDRLLMVGGQSAAGLPRPSASPSAAPGRVRNHSVRRRAISSSFAASSCLRNCAR